MKDRIVTVAGLFGRRFTGRQKTAFLNYIIAQAELESIPAVLDVGRDSRSGACRNLYLGNMKRASLLIAVPYDTPSRLFWPDTRYFPLNPGRNMRRDSGEMAARLLLGAAAAGGYLFLVLLPAVHLGGPAVWAAAAGMAAVAALVLRLIAGIPNRRNHARNSAGIVAALEYQRRFGGGAAVALLDQSCCSYNGYRQLAEYLGGTAQNKRIIVLDCATSGPELHVHCGQPLEKRLEKAVRGAEVHGLEASQLDRTMMKLFPKGILITGGFREQGEMVIADTRCGRDAGIDLEKIERTLEVIRGIAEDLQ